MEAGAGLPINTWFVSEEFLARNRDVVERFQRGMEKANRYCIEHPEEVRALLAEYTQIPKPLLADIRLPTFRMDIDPAGIRTHIELAQRYGFIEDEPEVDDLLALPPER